MSFTEDVKNELARKHRESPKERAAELLALLRMSGSVITGAGGKWGMEFSTSNSAVARRVLISLKKDFGLAPAVMVRQGRRLRKKNVYTLTVLPFEGGSHFLEKMDIWSMGKIHDCEKLTTTEEKQAYLAGAFLGGGTVSRPQSDYHLEMVTRSSVFAEEICKVMRVLSLHPKMTDRKNDYIVYIKDGDEVSAFLQITGASQCYLEFENVRVMKDMRNRVNRQVNCETANINKTVNAAVKQIEDIRLIEQKKGFHNLNEGLAEIAELRLQYPEATLKELGMMLNPQVGKSGVNHRLRKLSEIADELRMNEEDLL